MLDTAMTRRAFLQRTGWLAAGITMVLPGCSLIPVLPTRSAPKLSAGLTWIQILPGGQVRFLVPRMEMGQGVLTALSQIVAEELNVDLAQVHPVIPNTTQISPAKMTVGSESVSDLFLPLSHAAASLREHLRGKAAERAGVPADAVKEGEAGFVLPDGRAVAYGELVEREPLILSLDQAARLKTSYALKRPGQYKQIGRGLPRVDLRDIVTGKALYSYDAVVPGMLYGKVVRPPVIGATLADFDDTAARRLPGVVAVVVDAKEHFVGVVTERSFQLGSAFAALEVRWTSPAAVEQSDIDHALDVDRRRETGNLAHGVRAVGNVEDGRKSATRSLGQRYESPFAAHAAMEPRAGVVSVTTNTVEVWTSSQDPFYVRGRVARITGRDEHGVIVHAMRLGGGFGGRITNEAAFEAARLSIAIHRPVRVQWTREEEFQYTYYRPPYSHRVDAGVTLDGKISHWKHDFVSAPVFYTSVFIPAHLRWVLDQLSDEGTHRGAETPYEFAHQSTRYSRVRIPVPTSAWRGLGAAPNAFAIECAIDELAALAGVDPIAFRLRHLPPDSRLAACLRRVASMSAWDTPSRQGVGRGVACAIYRGVTHVAAVAEVRVDRTEQRIRLENVYVAHDCGLVVNPNQVMAQIEGNVVWGCGMALKERLTVKNGRMSAENFNTYEVVRLDEAPDIEIALINRPDVPPAGAGEPAIAPVAAAIANALYTGTGKRIRSLPITYEKWASSGEIR